MSVSFVHVKGLAALQAELDKLPAKLEANVMRSALRAGAMVIADEARRRVPVNTGALRDSIRVSSRSRRGVVSYSVKAGSKVTKKRISERSGGGLKVEYDNPYYAQWVEFGTAAHKINAVYAKALVLRPNKRATKKVAGRWMRAGLIVEGIDHPGARARPFMRPAMDTKAISAVEAVREAIRRKLASAKLSSQFGTVAPKELEGEDVS